MRYPRTQNGDTIVQQIEDAKKRNNEDWVHKHHDEKDTVPQGEDNCNSDDSDLRTARGGDRSDGEPRDYTAQGEENEEKFGTLRQITRAEYVSKWQSFEEAPVVLHLYQDYVPECELMDRALETWQPRRKRPSF